MFGTFLLSKSISMNRGSANSSVMGIGLAPGAVATAENIAFAGNSFRNILKWFNSCNREFSEKELRSKLYLTSLIKCGANPDKPLNRKKMWLNCAPFLNQQIEIVKPKLILLFGAEVVHLFTKIPMNKFTKLVGEVKTSDLLFDDLFPIIKHRCRWIFMPHPSGLSRIMNDKDKYDIVIHSLSVELDRISF
ncbi:hypothetical protein DQM28_20265 [Leptospira mayottensis]|nr:hypothetical protein DQM28_18775 [Leptospira mayottensis]AXR66521.1 hypothetical protein DQM28_20265 [Leptospira mayottensis]